MKKLIMFFAILFIEVVGYGQTPIGVVSDFNQNNTINRIFDKDGNSYNISALKPPSNLTTAKNNLTPTTLLTSMDCGYFRLFFDSGCGFENTSLQSNNDRRAVLCRVFTDISNFINSPLTTNGLNNKVNIWVRNINNLVVPPTNVLGTASGFYIAPLNSGTNDILDNTIWQTIHNGKDAYTNYLQFPFIMSQGWNTTLATLYHGQIAFNFNYTDNPQWANPNIQWNSNLNINSPSDRYDLYTVVLHEVTHALGIGSLIASDGSCIFGPNIDSYSRFDTFIKNNTNQPLISNGTNSCSLYNYSLNQAVFSEATNPSCQGGLKFSGSSIIPLFTPSTFKNGSSLSHFEGSCYINPSTGLPYGNHQYFTMTDEIGMGAIYTRRYLKTEERNVLCDIGYNVRNTFGVSTTFNGQFNYGGSASCGGIDVAGINDGLDNNRQYKYTGLVNTDIIINDILSNDTNAVQFECLEDLGQNSFLSVTSGDASTSIIFRSSEINLWQGLHILKYIPISQSGKRGNITYIYVFVDSVNNCASIPICNLVSNGGFETNSSMPNNTGQIDLACGWNSFSLAGYNGSKAEYFHRNSNSNYLKIPCNIAGSENDVIGNGYAGVSNAITYENQPSYESINTKLVTPLLTNKSYQLSFDVSLAEGYSKSSIKFQAYLSPIKIYTATSIIPISNPNLFFENSTFSTTTDGWEHISFTIPASSITGTEQYLYIGGLNNLKFQSNNLANQIPNCNYYINQYNPDFNTYYFIDNVELKEINTQITFNPPSTICKNNGISNLSSYLSSPISNGVFTGNGVVFSGGIYSFLPNTVGPITLTYTYTDTINNCIISIPAVINVTLTIPTFSQVAPICSGAPLSALPISSTNVPAITGTWSPAINNLATTTYTFTPTAGLCAATTTMTITILPSTDPSCSSNCPPSLVFSTAQTVVNAIYKASNTIVTDTNYIVNVGSTIGLRAGSSIIIKPNSQIKQGSIFTAKIQDCNIAGKFMNDQNAQLKTVLKDDVKIVIYPNPFNTEINVSVTSDKLKSITIISLDGKIIYDLQNIESDNLIYNTNDLQKGIYILISKTENGNTFNNKIIKN
jgi:hypothetical protein